MQGEEKLIFLCGDPRSNVIKPIITAPFAPHSSAAHSCASQGDKMH